ncbi:hypothetical protein WA158_007778 [Blastocystis sp. Blastoise]
MGISKDKKHKKTVPPEKNVEKLLEKAAENINKLNPEAALLFCKRALDLSPNDADIMDMTAELYLECEKPELAFPLLVKSTTVAPNSNFTKWMYLAQLSEGTDSLNCLKKGSELLSLEINKPENKENKQDLMNQLCQAYCSIAEMYTTDLCELPEAESECYNYLSKSLTVNPNHIETLILLGSCRMSQCREEEAEEACMRATEAINKCKEDTPELLPAYDSRFFLAKMLLEIPDDNTIKQRNNACIDIFDTLLLENDENEEVWWYITNCYYNIHKYTSALEFGNGCKTRVEKKYKQLQIPEIQAQVDAINQLLSDIQTDLNNGKQDSEDEEDINTPQGDDMEEEEEEEEEEMDVEM